MKANSGSEHAGTVDSQRRRLLEVAGAGVVLASLGSSVTACAEDDRPAPANTVRWGVIGTGGIANRMDLDSNRSPIADRMKSQFLLRG